MGAEGFAFLLCAAVKETLGRVYGTHRTPKTRRRDGKNAEISRFPRSCKVNPERKQSEVLYKHSDKLYKSDRRNNNE